MSRIVAWLRLWFFQREMRVLHSRLRTPEERLVLLDRQLSYLRECTFTQPPAHLDRTQTLSTNAHTCDNLLLDLADVLVIVEDDASYAPWTYPRRGRRAQRPRNFFVSNTGQQVPLALFVRKLLPLLTALVEHLENLRASGNLSYQHHLRQTSYLFEELIEICRYLLSASDQRLLPPAEKTI